MTGYTLTLTIVGLDESCTDVAVSNPWTRNYGHINGTTFVVEYPAEETGAVPFDFTSPTSTHDTSPRPPSAPAFFDAAIRIAGNIYKCEPGEIEGVPTYLPKLILSNDLFNPYFFDADRPQDIQTCVTAFNPLTGVFSYLTMNYTIEIRFTFP